MLKDKNLSFILKTPQDIRLELAARAKAVRLMQNLSQEGLARRAGVSAGTIKRFEKTGHISIDSLLKISVVLDAAGAFDQIFAPRQKAPASIDELLKETVLPQRGRIK